jgi:ADP-ribose pyrophosphatase
VCARRELEEETGFRAGSLEYLSAIWTTPGFTDEKIHLFLARDLTEGKVATDADEFLSVVRMRLSEALDRIDRGDISDAKSICALSIAARRLRR